MNLLGGVRIVEECNFQFHHATEAPSHLLLQCKIGLRSHPIRFFPQPSHEFLELGYGMEIDPLGEIESFWSFGSQGRGPREIAPFCCQKGGQRFTVMACIGGGFLDEVLESRGSLAWFLVLPLVQGHTQRFERSKEVVVFLAGHVGEELGQRRFARHGGCFRHRAAKQARKCIDEHVILQEVSLEHSSVQGAVAQLVHESMSYGTFPMRAGLLLHPIGEPASFHLARVRLGFDVRRRRRRMPTTTKSRVSSLLGLSHDNRCATTHVSGAVEEELAKFKWEACDGQWWKTRSMQWWTGMEELVLGLCHCFGSCAMEVGLATMHLETRSL